MASQDRSTSDKLELYRRMAEDIEEYDFFQALQLVHEANPQSPGLGRSSRPADDPIRLSQAPHLMFAPSTLASFTCGNGQIVPRLSVYFFGLFGPNGPLPLHLTELALQQIRNDKHGSLARFADLFHHRMLSLFYRAWAETQPRDDCREPFTRWVDSLVGDHVGGESSSLPNQAKRYYAARFADQRRSAEGLHSILSQYFSMPVDLEQFVGQHLTIPRPYQMRLGIKGEQSTLGISSTMGIRVWECQSKFRLTLGPLNLADYLNMLPGGKYLSQLIEIVKSYIGDELDWDIHLVLAEKALTPARLGKFSQLGWTSWLYQEQFDTPQKGLIIDPKREALT